MTNMVLYRKYRPKTFSEVVGQEHVVKTLQNALAHGLVSHAYLFTGPRGSGKTTLARLLAKAVNCEARKKLEHEPCNQCASCREINEGRAVDLIEIDAASHRGIEEMRALKDGIGFAPNRFKYKVYIIDEAHQLTTEANNALLKTLEEPPVHAIFILATTESHKMMATIISRCQRFDFRRLTLDQLVARLSFIVQAEGVKADPAALELIGVHSGGSFRDAESILDQVITYSQGKPGKKIGVQDIEQLLGLSEVKVMAEFAKLLLKKDAAQALKTIEDLYLNGRDLASFLRALIGYFRQALIVKINPESYNPFSSGLTPEQMEQMKKQIEGIGERELQRVTEILLTAENKMRYASIPPLPLELAVVEISQQKE